MRIDDRYPRNPKVMGLSDKAFRYDVEAMCYCAEQKNDGELPPAYLKSIPAKIRTALIEAGRWDVTDEGIFVHDYLDYNPSSNEKQSRSDAASNAARIRWSNPSGTRGTGKASEQKGIQAAFERFWTVYPRRVGKRAALAAFTKALTRADADAIVAGAERYAGDPKRHPDYTAHPTTWLNADRWTDEPDVAPALTGAAALPAVGTPEHAAWVEAEDRKAMA